MTSKAELEQALKEAMRGGDTVRKRTLRMALSEIKFAEVAAGDELEPEQIMSVLQKEAKSRRETIEDAIKAERNDLIQSAEAELAILNEYLPTPLTDDELRALVAEAIATTGASSAAEMGRVMGELMPRLGGKADGGRVSQFVRQALQDDG